MDMRGPQSRPRTLESQWGATTISGHEGAAVAADEAVDL